MERTIVPRRVFLLLILGFRYCSNLGIQSSLGGLFQCGLICGAIEESSRPLKAIDKRVFINCDKNAVFTHFRDKDVVFTHLHNTNAIFTSFCKKNDVFEIHDKNTVFGFVFVQDQINQSVLSIANLFYDSQSVLSIGQSILSIANQFYR